MAIPRVASAVDCRFNFISQAGFLLSIMERDQAWAWEHPPLLHLLLGLDVMLSMAPPIDNSSVAYLLH
jgi:hypothetical protein